MMSYILLTWGSLLVVYAQQPTYPEGDYCAFQPSEHRHYLTYGDSDDSVIRIWEIVLPTLVTSASLQCLECGKIIFDYGPEEIAKFEPTETSVSRLIKSFKPEHTTVAANKWYIFCGTFSYQTEKGAKSCKHCVLEYACGDYYDEKKCGEFEFLDMELANALHSGGGMVVRYWNKRLPPVESIEVESVFRCDPAMNCDPYSYAVKFGPVPLASNSLSEVLVGRLDRVRMNMYRLQTNLIIGYIGDRNVTVYDYRNSRADPITFGGEKLGPKDHILFP